VGEFGALTGIHGHDAGDPGVGADPADADATLHAVSAAVLAVTRHLSVREVLQVIVRGAAGLLEARYAALGVPDDRRGGGSGGTAEAAGPGGSGGGTGGPGGAGPATDGDGPAADSFAEFVVEGVTDAEWSAIGSLPRQHGVLAVMLREGRAQRLADIRTDPRFEGWPSAHPVLKDFLGVPIRDGNRVIGIIFLANKRRPGGFTERDEELLTLFAAHAAIALTNARLYERGRELTVIEERTRLARDLHDAVAQKLFSLRLTARAAATLVGTDPGRAAEELARVQTLAGEALAELRAAIFELRPADLIGDGLAESLRKHVEVLDRLHPAHVVFSMDDPADASPGSPADRGDAREGDRGHDRADARRDGTGDNRIDTCREVGAGGDTDLSPDREAAAFRIAQEAVYNALRHAVATRITVRLTRRRHPAPAPALVLDVGDDGRGFDPATAALDGLGLASMRERAHEAGGSLAICAAPGQGTRVRLTLPMPTEVRG
jgi:signal transduction histidine kinase